MKKFLLTLITIYQKTLSPDHGVLKDFTGFYRCRFYPTCSEYARQAIKQQGAYKGLWRATLRVIRCGGSGGGHDPFLTR